MAGEEIEGWRKEHDDDQSRHGAEPSYTDNYFPKYVTAALTTHAGKDMKL